MGQLGEYAVVVGTSIGGFLAGRALADCGGEVMLVERVGFPELRANRRGVPKARHGHLFMRRGPFGMSEPIPGVLDDVEAAGAPVWDDGDLGKLDVTLGASAGEA